ncbi:large subunit ribosomal protein LP0 [Angomonas deanei]|uniref:60S acidic ribosomal protein P0 n=1 Tax=Angomonas deanei TaxID=59799 RepID=S9WWH1_9TRYP|nr:large subunit ribosomal protein LP0 [Angomonas deanei]EPY39905.1 large subunit ribosomal protein LP0 [Angomonas deanei]EPY40370.1 large subunit ribosomal protein LP0 [Angomonas deanei]EPY41767.1 large subunit ribosomal protein LP0 [Angomonas deanei]CAD2215474.1 Ribosomal protein L10/Insertion domain in 60S ribosomal protein L10P/60s Acidic ribosomal protein, putative [Angomonas deanei]|eukprot:EPY24787.1 large subunit ribosomal protein LP0 [Angomonas deanei]
MPSITPAKREYEDRLNRCMTKYNKVLFVGVENVRSQQIHDVRAALRGKAEFVMGKKTLQAKIVEKRAQATDATESTKAFYETCTEKNLLSGNSGLVFTNEDVSTIKEILDRFRVKAPARVGAIAPCDVIIPAGNTGMEPTQTSFFQALNIATKIAKGTVEIVSEKKVLSTGDKVDNSTAALLQKLNISPFYYQAEILTVWDDGVLFTAADMNITDDSIEKMILSGISNVSAISMGAGIPTAANISSMIVDGFKNILGVSVATEYEFDEFNGKTLRDAAINGTLAPAADAAPAAAAGGAAPAAAGKKAEPEPEEEEEDFGMGGLF